MSKTFQSFIATTGLLAGMVFGIASCDTADEIFDCQNICSRYKDCFNKDYDVGACRSKCKENSGKNTEFRAKANTGEACIDDKPSCTSATFSCAVPCSGIVP